MSRTTGAGGPRSFDITAPLPPGTTVLEASAGTGKTYAIVGLAARHIAEGTAIDEVLLVTFSRAASAELRERMRERVRGLCVALADPASALRSPDPLERFLASGDPAQVAGRRDNLQRALSDFDASTIATTHTFCNRMLEALGFLGERDLVAAIVEDVDEMVAEAARDLYMDGFKDADSPEFGFGAAEDIARDAMRNPAAELSPDESELADPGSPAAQAVLRRVRFTRKLRTIVERRKRASRVRTYDDLQAILYRIVCDKDVGAQACARIREQFGVVLIDEFQDTDPQQWEIVRRCFHGHRPLVLVGDPKQSIYGFRGAEVLSYLSAVRSADQRLALDTNHRSDGDLVAALARIYGGAQLGHPEIVARAVGAARPGSRLHGAAPLRIRALVRADFTVFGDSGFPSVDYIRPRVIEDAADDIAALLSSPVRLGDESRPVRPGDIAVLVRTNKTVEPLRRALAERGIAAVVGSGASVFRTAAARHWLWVLTAIESPARTNSVRLAATTSLIGWSAADLADADDQRISALAAHIAEWGRVFVEAGFSAMAACIVDQMAVAARVLAAPHGERAMTDLLQVAAICNRQVMDQGWGISELTEWLTDRVADVVSHARTEDQTRRLESDAQAVQIMTVHASKGLQFPIVYLPFAWDSLHMPDDKTIMYHDPDGVRRLDVGGKSAPGRARRWAQAQAETVAEELRLLYVAATRAQSQVVMWWAPAFGTRNAPLHRLTFGGPTAGSGPRTQAWPVPDSVDVPDDGAVVAILRGVAAGTAISVEPARAAHTTWTDPARDQPAGALSAATFTREIDQTWRRTSYSAITAGAHGAASPVTAGSEPDGDMPGDMRVHTDDDSGQATDPVAEPVAVGDSPTASLMNGLPFGAAFGTVVHEALEYVDTSAPDIDAHVRELVAESVGAADIDIDVLTRAIVGVLTTPLGFGDLWSIPPRDRLSELDFEFPLGGEDGADGGFTVAVVADLLDRHLPAADLLAGYSAHLRELPAQTYRGFLTGSIDSVLRRPDGRFTIVDYKTNRLRPGDLLAEDFTAEAMAAEMMANHYPLQALIYSVALHRFLRWRLPGYEPRTHLAPAQYHFVRAMIGPETPPGCGVFEWEIPVELVVALSDLIAGSELIAGAAEVAR
ncbi:UvrD-helicase domain-containing protein [Gordonia sp. (in: high G+C Gram-positive bacteria)]|uniref:UvrD-helicase domain-containing protein n=1 Tax=Gordonia sp. (in: high G+C Gram-positive bacteria) TaxID=84139 RepID=UPI001D8970B2|nr:UvrD-helicase domain-containing protein [Gordonia sp. (in: high G+C Gram-positive bacteria)]MCB1294883.1 UvrD-helicase domain-containing protein [Gordonia sp. (in: high G+C Gram-positive bacteria)]HMS77376.1 UvrD-helicase domain-containing protein [Gordonia sp. (in: high G+C Gram-positive bacteria)]